jgi:uncharacterized protein DUF5916
VAIVIFKNAQVSSDVNSGILPCAATKICVITMLALAGSNIAGAAPRQRPADDVPSASGIGPQTIAPVEVSHSGNTGSSRTVTIPRALRTPQMDDFLGLVSPDSGVSVIDFRQRDPGDGIPVSLKTVAYLSYDDENLYAVFVCQDEPDKIRGRMSKREETSEDDSVTLYLDTFHDGRKAYYFSANPLGVQSDGIYSDGRHDGLFDTLWYSKGRITPDGYVVILSIPFRSMRYSGVSTQTWGIALRRSIIRSNENSYWPYITRRENSFVQQLGVADGLNVASSHTQKIELIPYAAYTDAKLLDASVPTYENQREFRAGLDAKWILRDSFVVDLTANPDFSTVESDEPQVTVNKRFEVSFPEKRPFFLENLAYFETPMKLLFTRRIVDPEFGARLTGKFGGWSLGLLGADDRAPGKLVDAASPLYGERTLNGAARVVRDLHKDSFAGVLVTERHFGDSESQLWSADTKIRLSPNLYFKGQAAGSKDASYDQALGLIENEGRAYFGELSYGGRHANYSAGYQEIGSGFRAPLAFVPRTGVRQAWQSIGYSFQPEDSKLYSFGPGLSVGMNWDSTGRLLDKYSYLDYRMDFAGPVGFHLARYDTYESFRTDGFRYHTTYADFYANCIKAFTFYGGVGIGTGVNYSTPEGLEPFVGRTENYSFGFSLRPTSRMRVEGYYNFSRFRAPEGFEGRTNGQLSVFSNHLNRTKVSFQFTRALSLRAIGDYYFLAPNEELFKSDRSKQLTGDVLLTYLVNPGTALQVGYNNGFANLAANADALPGLQHSGPPTYLTSRQVFVKLSYLFRY